MPSAATKSKFGKKIAKSYIFDPPHPQGHVMLVKYEEPGSYVQIYMSLEEPIDELIIKVW